ncbi:hypothetical protein K440DRAFT_302538 [Wilcoxina mikolae CBS 423.85]|nr:hypothetical protein K440DRAFT_302538 [Wilcoxina mikolae CBS 423.85]
MFSLRSLFHFLNLDYGTPIPQELEKRSTSGNTGLTTGETAGLVVGILGLFLTALTVFKGWECWKSRKDQTNSTGSSPSSATTVSHHVYHYFPSSPGVQQFPGQDIALETIHRGQHSSMSPVVLRQSMPSPPHLLNPLPPLPSPPTMPLPLDRRPGLNNTRRASTWPANMDATT